jgi:hypothetical protein
MCLLLILEEKGEEEVAIFLCFFDAYQVKYHWCPLL